MKKLNTSAWREYRIGDLFEQLELKCRKPDFNKQFDVSTERSDEFDLPLVNAKHFNNGIMYFGRSSDFDSAEMTLDIVKNGAIATGDVFAQPQRTGVLWDAYLIKPKASNVPLLALFFLAPCLERAIKDKFGYDDKCIWEKVKLLSVKLPATDSGAPDFAFMETYMKDVEARAKAAIDALMTTNEKRSHGSRVL